MALKSCTAPGISADQAEDQFYLLAEGSPDAIFVAVNEHFAYLNPAALRLFGATSTDQLLEQSIIERVHPDDRAIAAERSRCLHEEARRPAAPRTPLSQAGWDRDRR